MTTLLISCLKTISAADEYLLIDLDDPKVFLGEKFQLQYKRLMVRVKRLEKALYDLHLFCYNKLIGYTSFD
jgi:hypothetical protein